MADRVLVVDSESETEEVLRAVLEPRGLRVDRVRPVHANGGAAAPSVLVIDDDGLGGGSRDRDGWDGVPRVIIGSARLAHDGGPCGQRHVLAKPFQYPELIGAIERLLSERAA